jgi:hypothetical protein
MEDSLKLEWTPAKLVWTTSNFEAAAAAAAAAAMVDEFSEFKVRLGPILTCLRVFS